MSPAVLKGVGIGCFVACAILLFVAWDRYQDNANRGGSCKQTDRVVAARGHDGSIDGGRCQIGTRNAWRDEIRSLLCRAHRHQRGRLHRHEHKDGSR